MKSFLLDSSVKTPADSHSVVLWRSKDAGDCVVIEFSDKQKTGTGSGSDNHVSMRIYPDDAVGFAKSKINSGINAGTRDSEAAKHIRGAAAADMFVWIKHKPVNPMFAINMFLKNTFRDRATMETRIVNERIGVFFDGIPAFETKKGSVSWEETYDFLRSAASENGDFTINRPLDIIHVTTDRFISFVDTNPFHVVTGGVDDGLPRTLKDTLGSQPRSVNIERSASNLIENTLIHDNTINVCYIQDILYTHRDTITTEVAEKLKVWYFPNSTLDVKAYLNNIRISGSGALGGPVSFKFTEVGPDSVDEGYALAEKTSNNVNAPIKKTNIEECFVQKLNVFTVKPYYMKSSTTLKQVFNKYHTTKNVPFVQFMDFNDNMYKVNKDSIKTQSNKTGTLSKNLLDVWTGYLDTSKPESSFKAQATNLTFRRRSSIVFKIFVKNVTGDYGSVFTTLTVYEDGSHQLTCEFNAMNNVSFEELSGSMVHVNKIVGSINEIIGSELYKYAPDFSFIASTGAYTPYTVLNMSVGAKYDTVGKWPSKEFVDKMKQLGSYFSETKMVGRDSKELTSRFTRVSNYLAEKDIKAVLNGVLKLGYSEAEVISLMRERFLMSEDDVKAIIENGSGGGAGGAGGGNGNGDSGGVAASTLFLSAHVKAGSKFGYNGGDHLNNGIKVQILSKKSQEKTINVHKANSISAVVRLLKILNNLDAMELDTSSVSDGGKSKTKELEEGKETTDDIIKNFMNNNNIASEDLDIDLSNLDLDMDLDMMDGFGDDDDDVGDSGAGPKRGGNGGFALKMLRKRDERLFDFTGANLPRSYSSLCQNNAKQTPIVIDRKTKAEVDAKYPGAYTYAFQTGSDSNLCDDLYYICPKWWCPELKMPVSDKHLVEKDGKKVCPGEFGEEPISSNGDKMVYPSKLGQNTNRDLPLPCCFSKPYNNVPEILARFTKDEIRDMKKNRENQTGMKSFKQCSINQTPVLEGEDPVPEQPVVEAGTDGTDGTDDTVNRDGQDTAGSSGAGTGTGTGTDIVPNRPDVKPVVVQNTHNQYIRAVDNNRINEGQYGVLPDILGEFFENGDCIGQINSKTSCWVRMGIKQSDQPFLSYILMMLKGSDPDNEELQKMNVAGLARKIVETMPVEDFLALNSGNTLKMFMDTSADPYDGKNFKTFKDFLSKKRSRVYATLFGLTDVFSVVKKSSMFEDIPEEIATVVLREFAIHFSMRNFFEYLVSDVVKTHDIMLDVFHFRHTWLGENFVKNFLVFEADQLNDTIRLVCSKYYTPDSGSVDYTKPFTMVIHHNGVYEPIIFLKGSVSKGTMKKHVFLCSWYQLNPKIRDLVDTQKYVQESEYNSDEHALSSLSVKMINFFSEQIQHYVIDYSYKIVGIVIENSRVNKSHKDVYVPLPKDVPMMYRGVNHRSGMMYIKQTLHLSPKITAVNEVYDVVRAFLNATIVDNANESRVREEALNMYQFTVNYRRSEENGVDDIMAILLSNGPRGHLIPVDIVGTPGSDGGDDNFKFFSKKLEENSDGKGIFDEMFDNEAIFINTIQEDERIEYEQEEEEKDELRAEILKNVFEVVDRKPETYKKFVLLRSKWNPLTVDQTAEVIRDIMMDEKILPKESEPHYFTVVPNIINDFVTKDIEDIRYMSSNDMNLNDDEVLFNQSDVNTGAYMYFISLVQNPYKRVRTTFDTSYDAILYTKKITRENMEKVTIVPSNTSSQTYFSDEQTRDVTPTNTWVTTNWMPPEMFQVKMFKPFSEWSGNVPMYQFFAQVGKLINIDIDAADIFSAVKRDVTNRRALSLLNIGASFYVLHKKLKLPPGSEDSTSAILQTMANPNYVPSVYELNVVANLLKVVIVIIGIKRDDSPTGKKSFRILKPRISIDNRHINTTNFVLLQWKNQPKSKGEDVYGVVVKQERKYVLGPADFKKEFWSALSADMGDSATMVESKEKNSKKPAKKNAAGTGTGVPSGCERPA